jgi:cytochrome c551/c552
MLTAVTVLVAMMAGCLATSAQAAELMPPAQQNALVQKYCAVCHTDAVKNGGLSLEHFDAAHAAPSLTAMLLSKVTGGVSLKIVSQADTNADAAELVNRKMKSGAMGAVVFRYRIKRPSTP